jgi:hypothetical protein
MLHRSGTSPAVKVFSNVVSQSVTVLRAVSVLGVVRSSVSVIETPLSPMFGGQPLGQW